jgi:hypothetical protein
MVRWGKKFLLCCAFLSLAVGAAQPLMSQAVNVTTWHNDNFRTGDNLNETILTPSAVSGGTFGQLCVASGLDAPIYSQPLVFTNITVLGTAYTSVVYVVTLNDTLYAINGTPPAQGNACQIIGSVSLLPANQYAADCYYVGPGNGVTCSQVIYPSVGLLGTPVIGTWAAASRTTTNFVLYAVTETQNCPGQCSPSAFYHYLHAVDMQRLTEFAPPIRIYPPSFTTAQANQWSFQHIQRPGLLLTPNNYLYVAFSMMDGNAPLPNGSIFGYNVANFTSYSVSPQPLYFPVTPDAPNSAGGGVWQDGGGLAYGPDENGTNAIYFTTGNGLYDGSSNFADSFLKLDPGTLSLLASFTPGDQAWRNCPLPYYTDADFGSGAPMLTPATSSWPNIAINAEKEGYVWAMDLLSPGGYSTNNSQCPTLQSCTASNDCTLAQQNNNNLGTLDTGGSAAYMYFQSTPAYWFSNDSNNDEYVFLASVRDGKSACSINISFSHPPTIVRLTLRRSVANLAFPPRTGTEPKPRLVSERRPRFRLPVHRRLTPSFGQSPSQTATTH